MDPHGLRVTDACARPRVTMICELMNRRVADFMPLPRGPPASICIKIG